MYAYILLHLLLALFFLASSLYTIAASTSSHFPSIQCPSLINQMLSKTAEALLFAVYLARLLHMLTNHGLLHSGGAMVGALSLTQRHSTSHNAHSRRWAASATSWTATRCTSSIVQVQHDACFVERVGKEAVDCERIQFLVAHRLRIRQRRHGRAHDVHVLR